MAGRFAGLDEARTAIEALENAGIDGDDIDLLGRPAEAARTPSDPEIADRRLGQYLAPRVALGLVIGAVAGGLVGAGVAIVIGAAADVSIPEVVIACACIGVVLGLTLGAFFAVERSIGLSEEWPVTFEDAPEGPVWVGVYAQDPDEMQRARAVLAQQRPRELR